MQIEQLDLETRSKIYNYTKKYLENIKKEYYWKTNCR